ncbi:MAG: zinc ribbon domain-containing protein [Phycisphaerales bacterium]
MPEPEPAAVEETELEFYEEEDAPFPEDSLLTDDMPDLAALGAPTGELRELQSAPAASASKAGACPQCGAAVSPQAVICIQCGNNLKAGGKVKTKVGKAKAEGGGGGGGGITGRSIAAVIVGCVVAGFLGFLWFIIAAVFGRELGILAWGIGGLTGITVALISGQRSVGIGVAATCVAAFGLAVGKGLIFLTVVGLTMVPGAVDSFGGAMAEMIVNDPDAFQSAYIDHMAEQKLYRPELQAKVDAVSWDADGQYLGEDAWDDDLYAEMQAAADEKIVSMNQEEKLASMRSYLEIDQSADPQFDQDMQELSNLNAWSETFSLIDILWVALALGTAFSIGKGKE